MYSSISSPPPLPDMWKITFLSPLAFGSLWSWHYFWPTDWEQSDMCHFSAGTFKIQCWFLHDLFSCHRKHWSFMLSFLGCLAPTIEHDHLGEFSGPAEDFAWARNKLCCIESLRVRSWLILQHNLTYPDWYSAWQWVCILLELCNYKACMDL